MGSGNHSAIGTLVERTNRFLIRVHLPTGQSVAENTGDAAKTFSSISLSDDC